MSSVGLGRQIDYTALSDLYYDPQKGFQSATKLQQKLGSQYTLRQIETWLKSQTTDQRFRQRNAIRFFPMSIPDKPWAKCQTDLLDLTNMNPNRNGGNKFVYIAIDIFSRFVIGIPVKSKTESSCVAALKEVIERVQRQGFQIGTMTSDNEPAFKSRAYKDELKDNDIVPEYVAVDAPSRHKSLAFVDRFSRTIRNLMERYMQANNTNKWSDVLDSLIDNYNTSIHTSLEKTPAQALADPFDETSVYQEIQRARKTGKAERQAWNRHEIVVGSNVRYLLPSAIFSKRTKPRWSRAVYTVYKIEQNAFYYLDIGDNDDDDIINSETKFRKYELQLVDVQNVQDRPIDDDESISSGDDRDVYQEEERSKRRFNREGIDPVVDELPPRNRRPADHGPVISDNLYLRR